MLWEILEAEFIGVMGWFGEIGSLYSAVAKLASGKWISSHYWSCILGHPQPVLNADTIQILNAMGIQFLNQVFMPTADSEHGGFWLSATTLALNGRVADEWDLFISGLRHAGTCLTSELDRLCWDFAIGDGTVTTYQAYSALISESGIINASWLD